MSEPPTRNNRLLALDWLERAQAQLIQACYELSIVGPTADAHWAKARGKITLARERLDLADDFIDQALAPYSADLVREREKIITRRAVNRRTHGKDGDNERRYTPIL